MTSFNHYALGAVADWLHSTVGGISPLEPGWKVIQVQPVPGGNITSAAVRFDGPYGLIESKWQLQAETGHFELSLVVPPNSRAVVVMPSNNPSLSSYSTQPFEFSTDEVAGLEILNQSIIMKGITPACKVLRHTEFAAPRGPQHGQWQGQELKHPFHSLDADSQGKSLSSFVTESTRHCDSIGILTTDIAIGRQVSPPPEKR